MSNQAAISASGLVKVYPGDLRAVDGIDLRIESGEMFALLGPNGAGKTTFIKMLNTLLRPTEGQLEVFGIDVTADPSKARACFGYVSQEVALDKVLTGREHLELQAALYHLPKAEIATACERVLALVELSDRADDAVSAYSGGMKKRLEIACGLLHHPQLLILDEPTLGLDIHTRHRIWDYLRSLREEGVTLILTTHYLEEADSLCDRVAIIDHGRIQVVGTPAELKASLGGDVVSLQLGAGAQADEAVSANLRSLDGIEEVRSGDNGSLHLSVAPGGATMARILDQLRTAGLEVASIAYSQPSLDDVFFLHTGHSMRD